MAVLMQLNTAADFWLEMAVPYCSDYFAEPWNLRHALHAPLSLSFTCRIGYFTPTNAGAREFRFYG